MECKEGKGTPLRMIKSNHHSQPGWILKDVVQLVPMVAWGMTMVRLRHLLVPWMGGILVLKEVLSSITFCCRTSYLCLNRVWLAVRVEWLANSCSNITLCQAVCSKNRSVICP